MNLADHMEELARTALRVKFERDEAIKILREIVDPSGGWRHLRVDNAKSAAEFLRKLGEIK